jgi:putative mRNA 3-end processing factor
MLRCNITSPSVDTGILRGQISDMRGTDLLVPRPEGLHCPAGGFHIDPIRPVDRALVTHAHSDHATGGHGAVLATRETLDIMAIRLGEAMPAVREVARFGVPMAVGGVSVTFHPAGHVLGSAQIAVERAGFRVVASGDYKRRPDPTCAPFEPVPCDVFITEATFGLPVFRHPEPLAEIGRLLASLDQFSDRTHLVGVYALGKAQRVIRLLRDAGYDAPVYLHGSLRRLCDYYAERGVRLGALADATVARGTARDFAGTVVLGPPSAFAATWVRRFADPLVAFASGWMQVRARARQRGVELPLVVSDHCDWTELTETIAEVGPSEVWVTHGREEALVRWCTLAGLPARPLHLVGYEDEAAD